MKYETKKEVLCVDTGETICVGDIVNIKDTNGGGCGHCKIVKITDTGFHFNQGGSNKSIQYKNIKQIDLKASSTKLCKLKEEKTPDEIELLKYHHHERTTDEKSGEAVSIMEETQAVDRNMNLTINHSSMQPVYEQIVSQIKDKIVRGELIEETMLPSVRTLAKNIRVSALTVKKAYDQLEAEGFVMTVHGKGSYVACASQARMLEEKNDECMHFVQNMPYC